MNRAHFPLRTSLVLAALATTATAQAKVFGNSCPGASGINPTISASGFPLAGEPFTIDITGIPGKAGILMFGPSDTVWGTIPLPWDLTAIGLTGCDLNVSANVQLPIVFDGAGEVHLTYTNWMAGLSGYFQAYVFDFQFPTSFGSVTEGLKVTPKTVAQVGKGEIIITEFMQNPLAVGDLQGEWVELYNTTDNDIDIEDWRFGDDNLDLWLLQNGGNGVVVKAKSYFVLGAHADPISNGGATVDFDYDNIYMDNGSDTISLREPDTTLQDKLTYNSAWPKGAGFSIGLDPSKVWNQNMNNNPNNWCMQVTLMSGGDTGTSSAPNDPCP